jgi:pimeloyl-ACP methyl ester carboxylesterase
MLRAVGMGRSIAIGVLWLAIAVGAAPPPASAAWGAERKTVELANGMRMGYVEFGDPRKPVLVFLHGYTNSSLGYLPLGRLLARDYRVFLLDQRGHGESSKPACCYTRLDFAYDAKLFLDHFGIKRAHVAGHSLGGMVAQTFAAFWPERVDRLMIIGSTIGRRSRPSPDVPLPPPTFGPLDAEIRALKDPIDPDSAFMKEWWNVPRLDPQIQYHMRRESARIPADIWRAMLDQGEVSRDLRTTAPRITAPTLLLFGGKDALFSAEDNQDMARWLPHAEAVTLTDLGHSLPEEDPQAVADALLKFLR